MLSKTKKLTKGGDNIGRIVIMEFKAQDSTAFDDMLAFVKQHPDFEKLEISYEPTLSLSGLEINLSRRRVINNGQEIELTVKEYDILCLLAANKGRVLTYEQIYDKVWGEISAGNEKDTVGFTFGIFVKKLCDTNSHFSIDSVREIGYRFNSQ
ncbi:winged helix family transcriptional regulator [Ruminococcus sp. AF25-23LB]|nr:winged helix family transcriptional regulator [Ruminococcus sp. AF25-23LB]